MSPIFDAQSPATGTATYAAQVLGDKQRDSLGTRQKELLRHWRSSVHIASAWGPRHISRVRRTFAWKLITSAWGPHERNRAHRAFVWKFITSAWGPEGSNRARTVIAWELLRNKDRPRGQQRAHRKCIAKGIGRPEERAGCPRAGECQIGPGKC